MLTSFDLLIYAFIAMVAIALIGVVLQFVSKKPLAQKIGFYSTAALGAILPWCNFESTPHTGLYDGQIVAGFAFGALAIAAVIFPFVKKDEKSFKTAKLLATAAALGGLFCTFFI